jgi:hypothetical protein
MNSQIGTTKDSESLRDKLLTTEQSTNDLAKETTQLLKNLNGHVRNNIPSVEQTSDDVISFKLISLKKKQNKTKQKIKFFNF